MLAYALFSTSDKPKNMPSDDKPKRSIAQEIIQKSQDIKQEHFRIIERNDSMPSETRPQKPNRKVGNPDEDGPTPRG